MKDFNRVGSLRFVGKKINVPAHPFTTFVLCFLCEGHVPVQKDDVMAVFTIGNENVGICCDGCLTEDSRAQLDALRQEANR